MKQKFIKIRIVGPEDSTILEKKGVTPEAVIAAIQLLDDDTQYLEVSIGSVDVVASSK